MSVDKLSGPQKVALGATRIAECPRSTDGAIVADMVVDSEYYSSQQLHRFGIAKVVSDVVALRLPDMASIYPPFGFHSLYRDTSMEGPEWKAVDKPQLQTELETKESAKERVGVIRNLYITKTITHVQQVLKEMLDDPGQARFIRSLAQHGRVDDRCANETEELLCKAFHVIGRPARDNSDILFGLIAVTPAVLARQLQRRPTHDETITALRLSKRLPMAPSLLRRRQVGDLLIATTTDNQPRMHAWGFDFNPRNFKAVTSPDGSSTVVRYASDLHDFEIPGHTLDTGEFGETGTMPYVVIDPTRPVTMVGPEESDKTNLTCPSKGLIGAMWEDIVQISDEVKLFEPDSASDKH